MTDETVVETIVRAEVIQQFVDQALTVVDECILRIGSDGIRTAAVDPANVAMVKMHIGAAALENAPDGSFVVGANLRKLDDYLDNASGDDPVSFAFNTADRTLKLRHTNREFNVAMIDPEAIRKEPDLPELDLPVDVTIPAGELADAVETADLVSDHVAYESDAGAGEITVIGEGDIDDVTVTFDGEDLGEGSDIYEDARGLYSIEYLADGDGLLTALPATDVRWRFGEEFPSRYQYDYADGHASVDLVLAPRIQSE